MRWYLRKFRNWMSITGTGLTGSSCAPLGYITIQWEISRSSFFFFSDWWLILLVDVEQRFFCPMDRREFMMELLLSRHGLLQIHPWNFHHFLIIGGKCKLRTMVIYWSSRNLFVDQASKHIPFVPIHILSTTAISLLYSVFVGKKPNYQRKANGHICHVWITASDDTIRR